MFKRICRSLKYRLICIPSEWIENYRNTLVKNKSDKFLNAGERYDPKIAKMIQWNEPSHIIRYDFAKKYLDKDDTVLDIACGTGYGSLAMSLNCKYVVGVDISNQAIKYANSTYKSRKTKFIIGDFSQNQISADVVVSFETIEHIKDKNIADITEQLIKYCRKLLIASVPYKEIQGNNPYHYHFDICEDNFTFLKKHGGVDFYYQTTNGEIHFQKPSDDNIQNLIFILKKQ